VCRQAEPRRVCRRLQALRGWSHEEERILLPRGAGEGIPRTLWDVSDACTVRWLWERHLRLRVAKGHARHPLILDLGANDGLVGSMSLNLIQLGWDAVLVEPMEEMMAPARGNVAEHPRDGQPVHFCTFALSDRDGESLFETDVAQDIACTAGHLTTIPSSTTRHVDVVSVDHWVAMDEVRSLLDASDMMVLPLDIEGQELTVVRRLFELGVRPGYIIIEHLRTDDEHDPLFTEHWYRWLKRIRFNDLYERFDP